MPLLNRDQSTYYRARRIWRAAFRLAEERRDAPAIAYYWWLGGDLEQATRAEVRLLSTILGTAAGPPTTN